jgi:aldehyde dehydrogenase (NAD+)
MKNQQIDTDLNNVTPIDKTRTELKAFFDSHMTKGFASRKTALSQLVLSLRKHESEILEALRKDLGKNPTEGYLTELGLVYAEIRHTVSHLREWMEDRWVETPLTAVSSSSKIQTVPKGCVLIISPWNYPFQLVILPLVASIAAGNVSVIKPSEFTPHTNQVLKSILFDSFKGTWAQMIEGDAAMTQSLLAYDWDHVFFTGSTAVGRIVAKSCAEKLTPYTLELGGKSPCIVAADANMAVAAKRIVWGKFTNAGQTCVAPDYLLVEESAKEALVNKLKFWIKEFFGNNPQESLDFGRIITANHFDRLKRLTIDGISPSQIIAGGQTDAASRYVAPTLIDNPSIGSPIMKEEIFGPLLPILTWKTTDELKKLISKNPNPLAFYVFSNNHDFIDGLLDNIPFGGGCINHTLLHLSIPDLPFGGVRQSGLGSYHGRKGFETFSHEKSIFHAGIIDDFIKYPPFSKRKLQLAMLALGHRLSFFRKG